MKRKRILYVYGGLYIPNGMNTIISQKINYLADNTDYEIYVSLTERPELPHYYKLSDKVKWVNFDINFDVLDTMPLYKKIWKYWWKQRQFKKKLTDYMMDLRPDITVSVTRREINFLPQIHDGSKKIAEIHFARPYYRKFEKRFFPKFINEWISHVWMKNLLDKLRLMDRFVVLTQEDSHNWPELKNIVVIPNFVDMTYTQLSDVSYKKAIAVGRYSWQKGFDLLIKAWVIVHKRYPEWKLDIYGGGDNDSYQKLANDMKLSSVVICHSAVKDISEKYIESSMFVLSSRYEGFGLVLVEAMGAGLPVVSFACPCGPRDIVADGKSGVLVESGNVNQLADGICSLIENESLRKSMGKEAVKRAKTFTKEDIMPKWISLFESL